MSTPKIATVTRCVPFEDHSVLLDLEMAEGVPLSFRGGQYIIVDSGQLLPDGRAAKRAYSVLSSDEDQVRFTLAVRRIGAGLVSSHLMDLQEGDTVKFSGPWGRMALDLPLQSGGEPRATIFACGTGITSALGLVNSRPFADDFKYVTLVWLDYADAPFLSPACVREMLIPQEGMNLRYKRMHVASQDWEDPTEAMSQDAAESHLIQGGGSGPKDQPDLWSTDLAAHHVFLTGDGQWIDSLRSGLLNRGMAAGQLRTEYFFNRPVRADAVS